VRQAFDVTIFERLLSFLCFPFFSIYFFLASLEVSWKSVQDENILEAAGEKPETV
jgi:hypothetical protein